MTQVSTPARNWATNILLGVLGNALYSVLASGALISGVVSAAAYLNGHHPLLLERGITAFITCGAIAVATLALATIRGRVNRAHPQSVTPRKSNAQLPPLPMPTWISPEDRQMFIHNLKKIIDRNAKANIQPYPIQILYTDTEQATRLSREFAVMLKEAGWIQFAQPTVIKQFLPSGIWVLSSLSEPSNIAGTFLSVALNEIGIKHRRQADAQLRQFGQCVLFIGE
jgi:hypothetical protein